jgi:hypothetical protein
MHGFGKMALAAAFTAAAAPAGAERGGNIHLAITGDEDTAFTGQCTITTRSGEETTSLDGVVPAEHSWYGEAIFCEIKHTSTAGALEVVISKDGNRTRSRTQGGGGTIRLSAR